MPLFDAAKPIAMLRSQSTITAGKNVCVDPPRSSPPTLPWSARVSPGATVDLLMPDDKTITGSVSKIEVETIDGQAKSTVTVASDALTVGAKQALYQPGTPIRATLHLRDESLLAGPGDALRDFLRRLGL